ncbi:hypothetical protein [Rothia sp. HSID18069]|uniref:hypothetical protein n=1 Tax=Rothia sp. HSID18069 TaxID=2419515 RepID=UPI001293D11D|nr:hypothetical protein [Rothia sp. HSID18069]
MNIVDNFFDLTRAIDSNLDKNLLPARLDDNPESGGRRVAAHTATDSFQRGADSRFNAAHSGNGRDYMSQFGC